MHIPYPPENKPLPSLTLKFLHRYVCLDYKPPSHQVDCTHARAHTYVTPPFNWLQVTKRILLVVAFRHLSLFWSHSVMMALLAWQTLMMVLLLSSERVHTRNKSFPHSQSSSVTVYLTGHLTATLLEKKNSKLWIFPTLCDQWWCRPSTRQLQKDRDRCRFDWPGGGLYSREWAYSKISPPPSLSHIYCWKRGGGLFSGGYGNMLPDRACKWYTSLSQIASIFPVYCTCTYMHLLLHDTSPHFDYCLPVGMCIAN